MKRTVWDKPWDEMEIEDIQAIIAHKGGMVFTQMVDSLAQNFGDNPIGEYLRSMNIDMKNSTERNEDIRKVRLTDHSKGYTLSSSIYDSNDLLNEKFSTRLLFGFPKPDIISLSCEEIEAEEKRVCKMYRDIAEKNGIELIPIRAKLDWNPFCYEADYSDKPLIIFNPLLTERMNDDELAFSISHQLARQYCRHTDEIHISNSSFDDTRLDVDYKIVMAKALSRMHVYEADKVGLCFALNAGYKRPESLAFLYYHSSEYHELKASFGNDYIISSPCVAEREIALRGFRPEQVNLDKQAIDTRINELFKILNEKDAYILEHMYAGPVNNRRYKGLYLDELKHVRCLHNQIERVMLERVIPSVKIHNEIFKQRLDEISENLLDRAKASLFIKEDFMDLWIRSDTYQDLPGRKILVDEIQKAREILAKGYRKIKRPMSRKERDTVRRLAIAKTPSLRVMEENYYNRGL